MYGVEMGVKCAQNLSQDVSVMISAQGETMRAGSVHVVMRHAIVEVQCELVVNVVIGVHIVVLCVLLVVRVIPIFLAVILYEFIPLISRSHFHTCFHCILTVFEVLSLHTPSVTVDRCQL